MEASTTRKFFVPRTTKLGATTPALASMMAVEVGCQRVCLHSLQVRGQALIFQALTYTFSRKKSSYCAAVAFVEAVILAQGEGPYVPRTKPDPPSAGEFIMKFLVALMEAARVETSQAVLKNSIRHEELVSSTDDSLNCEP